jgi:L-cysteate sulfo-lyase
VKQSPLAEKLDAFRRAGLVQKPTPLDRLDRLSDHLGKANIYIKRDDCTGLAFGGNKTRKLDFVVGKAIEEGADALITAGGIQSNHARQTAAAAAKLGLDCHLILQHAFADPTPEYLVSGNALLDNLLGARLHVTPGIRVRTGANILKDFSAREEMETLAAELIEKGKKPFIIPIGASTPLGSLGYVECASEILLQASDLGINVDAVIVANGSAGTQAGLIAGLKALGSDAKVFGVAVADTDQSYRQAATMSLCNEILELLEFSETVGIEDVRVDGHFVGEGYGYVDDDLKRVITDLARREGILVDPVYSGKALQALYQLSIENAFERTENIVFVHTGGLPALFAYAEMFSTFSSECLDLPGSSKRHIRRV